MFSNFLFFLIALIIYTTSEFFHSDQTVSTHGVAYSVVAYGIFVMVTRLVFRRLNNRSRLLSVANLDSIISRSVNRLSVFALCVFALMLYLFRLNFAIPSTGLIELFPTLRAILFLSLFLSFLMVIWFSAYDVHQMLLGGTVSKKAYVLSNVSFVLPALLPWFLISIVADTLVHLPWQAPRAILETPAGEIGYVAFFLVVITVFGPVLIKKLWLCQPLEPGYARSRIESVCRRAGLKYADILRWDMFGGNMITAGVMGIVSRFRYILVTPALFQSLNEEELESVMLHEIGHVQKHHMIFYLFFFAGFIACNFVFFEPVLQILYILQPVYTVFEAINMDRTTVYPMMMVLTLIGFFILYFRVIFGFFMRNFERQADLHVYEFAQDGSGLISTFYKIAAYSNQAMDKPNWHHYSIGQRIAFLEKCRQYPETIAAHHQKVKKWVAAYAVIMAFVIFSGYSIQYGSAKPLFDEFIAEKILFQQIAIGPENADLYTLVGDYYYHRETYQRAIDAYENVLRIDPENVHALNNLAWLYATCPDPEFTDPPTALKLAQKAFEISQEAFVLDTYAEALFVNNDVENAVRIAEKALRVSTSRKAYYLEQFNRFEKHLPPKPQEKSDTDG